MQSPRLSPPSPLLHILNPALAPTKAESLSDPPALNLTSTRHSTGNEIAVSDMRTSQSVDAGQPSTVGEQSQSSLSMVLPLLLNLCNIYPLRQNKTKNSSPDLPSSSSHTAERRHFCHPLSSYTNIPMRTPWSGLSGPGLDYLKKEMREFRKSFFTMPALKSIALK